MGALTGNRKRGEDYFKSLASVSSPIEIQSYGHISKKTKLSASMSEHTAGHPRTISSSSIVSRISAYPDTKRSFSRAPHAPVRNLRFRPSTSAKKFDIRPGYEGSSANEMGNFLRIQQRYEDSRNSAIKTLRYFTKDDCRNVEKEKVDEVIEIDDDKHDVSDDSSIEEVDVVEKDGYRDVENSREFDVKMVGKEFWSLNSSVVSDVSNANGKAYSVEKMDLMMLDHKKDHMSLPVYKKLYKSTKQRNGKLHSLLFEIELNEKRSQEYQYLRSQTKGKQVKKNLAEECFTPLTEEEERDVADALSNYSRTKVVVSHRNSNIDITGKILQCLKPGAWLNDEVINVYLELLKEREKREPQKFLKCHFLNTFFYKKLISGRGGYNFQAVRRWTTQKKLGYSLLECDKIFVPIHQQIHWCLAIINKKEEKFQYLDSLGGVDSQVLHVLAKYYVDEVKEKSGKEIDVTSWELEYVRALPEQENGFDCGMFMIKYADFYCRDLGLCFGQEHMPYFRKRTAKELLRLRAE